MINPYKTAFLGFTFGCLTVAITCGIIARRDLPIIQSQQDALRTQLIHERDSLTRDADKRIADTTLFYQAKMREMDKKLATELAPIAQRKRDIPKYDSLQTAKEYRIAMDYFLNQYRTRQ